MFESFRRQQGQASHIQLVTDSNDDVAPSQFVTPKAPIGMRTRSKTQKEVKLFDSGDMDFFGSPF